MPDDVYNLCFSKLMTSDVTLTADASDPAASAMTAHILASADSVMAALVKNFPTITFLSTDKATKDDDAGRTSATVAFSTNRAGMQFRLPTPLALSPVAQVGFKYYVESYYRVAGLDIIETNAARLMTGL